MFTLTCLSVFKVGGTPEKQDIFEKILTPRMLFQTSLSQVLTIPGNFRTHIPDTVEKIKEKKKQANACSLSELSTRTWYKGSHLDRGGGGRDSPYLKLRYLTLTVLVRIFSLVRFVIVLLCIFLS